MAQAHAAREGTEYGSSRNHDRVRKAVFDQAFEFIPEGADWTVVNRQAEAPKLVAVEDDKLYVLTVVGDLTDEIGPLLTSIRAITIDPKTTTVECETAFRGVRQNANPMKRDTTWTFSIGADTVVIESSFDPEWDARPGDADTVARKIAGAAGWGLGGSIADYAIEAA
jgi:hypothetical protein